MNEGEELAEEMENVNRVVLPATIKTPWYAGDGSKDRKAAWWAKEEKRRDREWREVDERMWAHTRMANALAVIVMAGVVALTGFLVFR